MLRKTLFLMIIAALVIPVCAHALVAMPLRIAGEITSIDTQAQTIAVKGPAASTTFKLTSTTRIMKDGVTATLQDLQVGNYAIAIVTKTADGLVAQGVMVMTRQAPAESVSGVIGAVDLAGKTITLKTKDAEVGFTVTDKTRIVLDGQPSTLDKLQAGYNARVAYTGTATGATAIGIEAASHPPLMNAYGRISSIDYTAQTFTLKLRFQEIKLSLDGQAVIMKDAFPADFSKLAVGDMARVAFYKNADGGFVAVKIDATSTTVPPAVIRGTIAEIDADNHILTIQTLDNQKVAVAVGPGTEILKAFGPVPFNALMTGDRVEISALKLEDGKPTVALKINVVQSEFSGKISALDLTAHTITVAHDAVSMTFKVGDQTLVMKNGMRTRLNALPAGDLVVVGYFNFPDGASAVRINAKTAL